MYNHYASIGYPVETSDDVKLLAQKAARAGDPLKIPIGAYIVAALPDGSQLWVPANEEDVIVGCLPHFQGDTSVRVRVGGVRADPENRFEGGLLVWASPDKAQAGDPGAFPFLVDVPDFRMGASGLPTGAIVELQIAAFAHELVCFTDENDMRASGGPMADLPPRFFVPTGLMNPDGSRRDPPRAMSYFAAPIRSCERIENPVSHAEYWRLVVESLDGTLDVVADDSVLAGQPTPGGIALGEFWLSARLV